MEPMDLVILLAEHDLSLQIVDGKLVIEGPQERITPEMRECAKRNYSLLHTYAFVEAGGGEHLDDEITEIKP